MNAVPSLVAVNSARSAAVAALAGLAVLKVVMLAALFTRTEPYPPPHFAPLFSASLALTVLAIALVATRSRWFVLAVAPIVLESLLSFGPHKLYPGESDFFAQTPAVYPAIVVGSVLIAIVIVSSRTLFHAFRADHEVAW